MDHMIQNQLMSAAVQLEKHLDQEINRLDSMGGSELEKLREERLKEMKKQQLQRQEWRNNVKIVLIKV